MDVVTVNISPISETTVNWSIQVAEKQTNMHEVNVLGLHSRMYVQIKDAADRREAPRESKCTSRTGFARSNHFTTIVIPLLLRDLHLRAHVVSGPSVFTATVEVTAVSPALSLLVGAAVVHTHVCKR